MTRIGIISDTHGFLDKTFIKHLGKCDEIWHAGDIGGLSIFDQLNEIKPTRAVYGNIDNHEIRSCCTETNRFTIENVDVFIKHIVGYPGKYDFSVRDLLFIHPPKLLIAGHSHILKIIPDKKNNLLFINPGAAGNSGFHKVKTMVTMNIDQGTFKDLEVIELKR